MVVIVCLDDRWGMLYNGRRQSKDGRVTQTVAELTGSDVLWMNRYSSELFDGVNCNVRVAENFLELADAGEYCFVENGDLSAFLYKAEKIIAFRWNRLYPSDTKFPADLDKWKKVGDTQFCGNSHEIITLEEYLP